MKRLMSLVAGVGVVAGLAAYGVGAADPAQDDQAGYVAQPAPEHALLKKDLGIWDAEVKAWMPGSDEPMTSTGTETNRTLGDLWLVTDFRGEFGGQPFRGHGTYGYDTNKKKYVGNWVDSMTTSIMELEGTYDAEKHELVMTGESVDPASNTKMKIKNVAAYHEDGTRTMTMYMENPEAGGESIKLMEIHYKKRADLPEGKKKGVLRKKGL